MNQDVYLICGVSGSGKTWVCRQLKDKFDYVPHDENFKNLPEVLLKRSKTAEKPLITECPFAERVIKEDIEKLGLKVTPVFVIENPDLIKDRYQKREGKELPKAAHTRASTIVHRAKEWGSVHGTADYIYKYLKGLSV